MRVLFLLFCFSPPAGAAGELPWLRPWHGLPELMAILNSIPDGREILAKAERKDPTFAAKIKRGEASFTESTFSRTYSLLDGKEEISFRHEVTLNLHLSLADATVDLAHELVHYTEKGMLDPYRKGFELAQFVRNGIEGEGGELKALAVECRVAWALEARHKSFPRHRLCARYRREKNRFDAVAAQEDYYALGPWLGKGPPELRQAIPELSGRSVVFTSSYASKPYPLALAEEYAMTRKAACANNRRKYKLIASQAAAKGGRGPASTALWQEKLRLRAYEKLYCGEPKEGQSRTSDIP